MDISALQANMTAQLQARAERETDLNTLLVTLEATVQDLQEQVNRVNVGCLDPTASVPHVTKDEVNEPPR